MKKQDLIFIAISLTLTYLLSAFIAGTFNVTQMDIHVKGVMVGVWFTFMLFYGMVRTS